MTFVRIETAGEIAGSSTTITLKADPGESPNVIRDYLAKNSGTEFKGNIYSGTELVLYGDTNLVVMGDQKNLASVPRTVVEYYAKYKIPIPKYEGDLPGLQVKEATAVETEAFNSSAGAAHAIVADAYKRAIFVHEQTLARTLEAHERVIRRSEADLSAERDQLFQQRRRLREEHAEAVGMAIRSSRTMQAHMSVINARVVEERVAIPQILARAGVSGADGDPYARPTSQAPQAPQKGFWGVVDSLLQLFSGDE